jgi:hypothetical protein
VCQSKFEKIKDRKYVGAKKKRGQEGNKQKKKKK